MKLFYLIGEDNFHRDVAYKLIAKGIEVPFVVADQFEAKTREGGGIGESRRIRGRLDAVGGRRRRRRFAGGAPRVPARPDGTSADGVGTSVSRPAFAGGNCGGAGDHAGRRQKPAPTRQATIARVH